MCGIAGIVSFGDHREASLGVAQMMRALAHRGPDGEGTVTRHWGQWTIGLAHTRLAILDLSEAGRQPMNGGPSLCWLAYNGEAYNFFDLRRELEHKGCTFQSKTDTEVLLRSYELQGVSAITRLRGMFAFALWDERDGKLVLARDAFGIKPLYYFQTKSTFVFASEVRAILASGLVPRRLNLDGLTSYLYNGSIEAPGTIIEGVRSVKPGHHLIVNLEANTCSAVEAPYGESVWKTRVQTVAKRSESISRLRDVLLESVRLHLVSDVPLGVFLSGGLDSTAIVALMSQVTKVVPRTFNINFAEAKFSEASFARFIAKQFATDHKEIFLTEDNLLSLLPSAFIAMDQPTMDGMNTYVISRAVRQAGLTVALSGMGGDELFAGYPSFRRVDTLRRVAKIPMPLRAAACAAGKRVFNGSVSRSKFWDLLGSDCSVSAAYSISRRLFAVMEVEALLSSRYAVEIPPRLEDQGKDAINAVSACEMRGYMANTLLRDADCMSMDHGLEIRVPFVDPVVVRSVLEIPGSWKLDRHQPKPLLLEVLGGLLPQEVRQRPKMGFVLPFERWMQSALKHDIDKVFADQRFSDLGIDCEAAKLVWQAFKEKPSRERWTRPWALYSLGKWCELNSVRL